MQIFRNDLGCFRKMLITKFCTLFVFHTFKISFFSSYFLRSSTPQSEWLLCTSWSVGMTSSRYFFQFLSEETTSYTNARIFFQILCSLPFLIKLYSPFPYFHFQNRIFFQIWVCADSLVTLLNIATDLMKPQSKESETENEREEEEDDQDDENTLNEESTTTLGQEDNASEVGVCLKLTFIQWG